ncbi:MAG: bifunctional demethylmenaquinone methyltransferase/2-methoxy-6-polyprenyl-1,4-benzoquinol methylase UbiE [Coraliomargaritaceae bacterium]
MHIPIGSKVEKMFSGIANKYDFLNHILSFGLDYYWRHRLAKQVQSLDPNTLMDVATGSGDVAFKLSDSLKKTCSITATDFCQPMLDQAKLKQEKSKNYNNISFEFGDAMSLNFPDNTFDVVTIAFGVRNFEHREKGLQEILRVLKPKGSLFILEFSQPITWFRPFYFLYLKYILPSIAGLVSKDKNAYKYLAGTIESFPSKELLKSQLLEAGYSQANAYGMTFSTVAIHKATKNSD